MQAGWSFAESADEAGFQRADRFSACWRPRRHCATLPGADLERSHLPIPCAASIFVLAAIRSHDFHGIINSKIGDNWREVDAMRCELQGTDR